MEQYEHVSPYQKFEKIKKASFLFTIIIVQIWGMRLFWLKEYNHFYHLPVEQCH